MAISVVVPTPSINIYFGCHLAVNHGIRHRSGGGTRRHPRPNKRGSVLDDGLQRSSASAEAINKAKSDIDAVLKQRSDELPQVQDQTRLLSC